jgi:hypothetical protein
VDAFGRRHARQLEEDAAALRDVNAALRAFAQLGRADSAKQVPARCGKYIKTQQGADKFS